VTEASEFSSSCPACGGPLVSTPSGSSMVVSCSRCAWSVATTNQRQPQFDPTSYAVFASSQPEDQKKAIAFVAVEFGLPIAAARKVISLGQPVEEKANAIRVIELQRKAKGSVVKLSIQPPFPWPTPAA
jgi:hypothetical protein